MDLTDFLDSGSTLLNCALTGNPFAGFRRGGIYTITGPSGSGKSYFSMTQFAEAAQDSTFDEYDFVQDNPEDGTLMDFAEHFGEGVQQRVQPAAGIDEESGKWMASTTLEEMYGRFMKWPNPFIGVVDSLDALSTLAEEKKTADILKGIAEDRETAGVMTDGKAKVNSAMLRQCLAPVKRSGSILFLICQTRDSLGGTFAPQTRAGGRALKFYATTEIWIRNIKTLTKQVKGKKREYGFIAQLQVKKLRTSAVKHAVTIPIIHNFGFDDISSCVDWLIDNNHWKVKNKSVVASEFSNKEVGREKLIRFIESDEERIEKLRITVGEVWAEIEEALRPKRKKRYE